MIRLRITIHLVARLFRIPLLRVDGTITLADRADRADRTSRKDVLAGAEDLPVGRLLALAESELAVAEDRRQRTLKALR